VGGDETLFSMAWRASFRTDADHRAGHAPRVSRCSAIRHRRADDAEPPMRPQTHRNVWASMRCTPTRLPAVRWPRVSRAW